MEKEPALSLAHPLWMAFYSREVYQDVRAAWRGRAVVYLAVLLLITTLPIAVTMETGVSALFRMVNENFVPQLPPIHVENGEATVQAHQPYFITYAGSPVAIIDTTGQINALPPTGPRVLMTKTRLLIKHSDVEQRDYEFTRMKSFYLDQDRARFWLAKFARWMEILLVPMLYAALFIKWLIEAFLFALIGLLVARLSGAATFDLAAAFPVTIVALTPALWLTGALSLTGRHYRHQTLVFLLIELAYLLYAINAATEVPGT